MYTEQFAAYSDYLIQKILQTNIKEEVNKNTNAAKKLIYDIADNAVHTKEILAEYPRIAPLMFNVGNYELKELLPIINNTDNARRRDSVDFSADFHLDTKREYIQHSPTNFLIIGKPGVSQAGIAEKMQKKFYCTHIDCNELVDREIKSKSRLGHWLNRNLKLDKILPIEIILWLVQRETAKSHVVYRGYVLTGFPIIPSTQLSVKRNFLTEEEFDIFQQIIYELVDYPVTSLMSELEKLRKKLFTEYLDDHDDDDDAEEETNKVEEEVEHPQLFHRIITENDVRCSINRQLNFLLDLENKPNILIYLACDDDDIITKNRIFEKKSASELEAIQLELDRFNFALAELQHFVCYFPRPNCIFCHGIFSPDQMFEIISSKILELRIRRVFFPVDFFPSFKDDETVREKLDVAVSSEQKLTILCAVNSVRDDIKWCRSVFETKCPVMLTRGKCVIGKYEHAVLFTGEVYMLSSDESKREFLDNPQDFIRCVPNCRVGIMGPRFSGKTTFAYCLEKFFENSVIIDVNFLFNYYKKNYLHDHYYAEVCKDIVQTIRTERWERFRQEVQQPIDSWIELMKINIKIFLKPHPKTSKHKSTSEQNDAEKILKENNFATSDVKLLKMTLESEAELMKNLPAHLRKEKHFREPSASDFDIKPLVDARMKELLKDFKMPTQRMLEILVDKIRLCEKRQQILTNKNLMYGYWILDGLPPDLDLLEGLRELGYLPDVIICMGDLVGERLAENQNIKCPRGFYDMNYVFEVIYNQYKTLFTHLNKKKSLGAKKDDIMFKKQLARREIDRILFLNSDHDHDQFQEENTKFLENFENVKLFMKPLGVHLYFVDMHDRSWTDTIVHGLKTYMNYFRAQPHILSEEEIESREILRYGRTANYCPVLFVDKTILKLGFKRYAIEMENKVRLLSSEEALNAFIDRPYRYSVIERPFRIPPYRLCVIGNYNKNRRSDLLRLAEKLGVKHYSIRTMVNLYFSKLNQNREFNALNYQETIDELGETIVKDVFGPCYDEGFLFEDFPLTAKLLQQMIDIEYYPEQIFYLRSESGHLISDEYKYYKHFYQDVLRERIEQYENQNINWMEERRLRYQELWTNLSDDFLPDAPSYAARLSENLESMLEYFNVEPDPDRNVQIKQIFVADKVNEEMPPDKFTRLIEETKKIPLQQKIRDFMSMRHDEIAKIKLVADENAIPFISIRLHPNTTKEIEKTFLKHLKLSTDRQYIFERAYPMNYANAVEFIHHGQFMLSRFFKNCPVRNEVMEYPVKLIADTPDLDNRIQPFLYHEHIYFVQKKFHNTDAFQNRPFQYTMLLNGYQLTPTIRIAVRGPKGSGCTTLSRRISDEFQLPIFSLTEMKNYVVQNFKWTKLATELIKNGMNVTDQQQVCELVKITTNFATHGWILCNVYLSEELIKMFMVAGIDISLMVVLKPSGSDLWTNFTTKYNFSKYKYKTEVIQNLYCMVNNLDEFSKHSHVQLKGFNKNYLKITDFISKWKVWDTAYRQIINIYRQHNLYEVRRMQWLSASLFKLNITDDELKFRLSTLHLYCPMCWTDYDLLVKYEYRYFDSVSAEPIYSENLFDKNLFQYLKFFYWSCNDHLVELMVNPQDYLPSTKPLPNEIPALIKHYKCCGIANEGCCPVTYLESGNVTLGLREFSVYYCNKIYVMSNKANCLKFLQNATKYKDVDIKFTYSDRSTIDEDLKNMKLDFGTLTPTLITNALLECSFERPKHYALDAQQSLEIFLGLYLKCNNSSCQDSDKTAMYTKMFLKYWDECKLLQREINSMEMSGNPYIKKIGEKIKNSRTLSTFSSSRYSGF